MGQSNCPVNGHPAVAVAARVCHAQPTAEALGQLPPGESYSLLALHKMVFVIYFRFVIFTLSNHGRASNFKQAGEIGYDWILSLDMI